MRIENCDVGEAGCAPVHTKVRKKQKTGGCYGSTESRIVVPRRSWRDIFLWKTGERSEPVNVGPNGGNHHE
jgi:hypothetical protein